MMTIVASIGPTITVPAATGVKLLVGTTACKVMLPSVSKAVTRNWPICTTGEF